MTNHSEATGFSDGDDTGRGEQPLAPEATEPNEGGLPEHQVTLRTPAELADALPYLLGYRPEDSIVLVALHDRSGRGRFGGRARLGIPAAADDWDSAAGQLAHGLVTGSERKGARPEQMVAFLCQEPAKGETGRQVMERLRPLAQKMRVACGNLDVPVIEALCISDGRFWSYCCDRAECCPPEGRPMGLPGTSVLAAAATYAGVQVRGTLRELRARLLPWETAAAPEQEVALDTVGLELVARILDDTKRAGVAEETLELAERLRCRFAEAAPVPGTLTADLRDDGLLGHDEAARLILGLQDRATRDRAAEWMEGDEAAPALRLWRALARRCVGPYSEHAAAPLTLAGWVAWSTGDELEAREALAMALGVDRDYLFARLLHQACNEGLDPESIRRCLRAERVSREQEGTGRLDQPEHIAEPAPGDGAVSAPASGGGGGRGPRPAVGAASSLPRSTRGTGRNTGERGGRASSAARPRASAGNRPVAVRPGGTAPRSSKGSAARTSRKGAARHSGRPDGLRSGGAGGEDE
ncbi:DUF4192 domain-containing protein [Streptomyces sp. NPDC012935]|uniref:DUF4192 domain-containing protein n=1 Tax=Streptomyces sp. NPDC012935 TaxID=3364857 RepID=UPI0036A7835F